MKKVFIFFALAAVVLSLGLNGCAKEDPAKPLDVDLARTATIYGTILVNANEAKASAEQKYSAPSIKAEDIIVTVPYSALNSGAAGTYVLPKDKVVYSNGKYTITVPVGIASTQVTVKVSAFAGTVRKTVSGSDKEVDVIWKSQTRSVSVVAGEVAYASDILLSGSSSYDEVKADGSNVH